MSQAKVKAALIQAYKTGGFFSDANTQWENSTFTQPNNTPWAQLFYVPAQPAVATLSPIGEDEVNGFIQINLNYPLNSGTQAIEQKADSIKELFEAGTIFTYSGQEVRIRSCGRSPGQIVNSFYRIAVTVVFYARIRR